MPPQPLIVTVAPNGSRIGPGDHPAVPVNPAQLADTAARCLEAGAAVLHLHVRDGEGAHCLDVGRYREAIAAVRDAVGERMVVQATTEAAGRFRPPEQMALVRELCPEAVSLALREFIPGDAVEPPAREFLQWLAGQPIHPQLILYSATDVARYCELRAADVIPEMPHDLLFVLGRYGTAHEAEPTDLLPFLRVHDGTVPWAACAFGPREHACVVAAAALGGHVRVGFENNLRLRDGRTAPDNAALVAQVAEAASALGRPLATAAEVRDEFGARR